MQDINENYNGDLTEIEGYPTVNGRRMGFFMRKRFDYWRDANRKFLTTLNQKFDINAEYKVEKNDFLKQDLASNEYEYSRTNAHDDYILGGGICYGGNVGDNVSFQLIVQGDGINPEIRIRKLQMTCRDALGNVTFEMLFGGFDYDNSLNDFFKDFVESRQYSFAVLLGKDEVGATDSDIGSDFNTSSNNTENDDLQKFDWLGWVCEGLSSMGKALGGH